MAEKQLTARQEKFAQNVALRLMNWRDAALDAGYSEHTVNHRGPKYLLDRPEIAARIEELKKRVIHGSAAGLEEAFMQSASLVTEALSVQAGLMRNAESEAVRERAARSLIELGKGLLLASRPKDSSFQEAMVALYQEAQRRKQNTIEIKGEKLADADE